MKRIMITLLSIKNGFSKTRMKKIPNKLSTILPGFCLVFIVFLLKIFLISKHPLLNWQILKSNWFKMQRISLPMKVIFPLRGKKMELLMLLLLLKRKILLLLDWKILRLKYPRNLFFCILIWCFLVFGRLLFLLSFWFLFLLHLLIWLLNNIRLLCQIMEHFWMLLMGCFMLI